MISQAFFSFFQNSDFLGFLGVVKEQKMTINCQFQSLTLYISRTVDHIKIFDIFCFFFKYNSVNVRPFIIIFLSNQQPKKGEKNAGYGDYWIILLNF